MAQSFNNFWHSHFYTKVVLVSINKVLLSNCKQHSTVSAVNVKRRDQICEYRSAHKIRIFSLSAIKWLGGRIAIAYKMGRSSDLTCEQQMVMKALSTARKISRGDFKTSRLFSVCCEQVSARQVVWTQEMWPQMCYHQARRPEAGEIGALGPISEVRGNDPAVECGWCVCITINNLSQNKGNGLCQPRTTGEASPEF